MKEDRLSGLALMYIHKHGLSFSAEDIVDDFFSIRKQEDGTFFFQLFGLTVSSIVGEGRFFSVVLRSTP